ncbi:DinB family protein [Lentibacillus sp. N15]|uniref:DinB family protein n=1 Tax=Lentibacillus songyuanensis TaxID=3136161 RepID=UPI0031BB3B7A
MHVNEEARESLLKEVNGISDDNLNKQPDAASWSIKQILEHLFLMEGVIVKMIENELENGKDVQTKPKPIELTVNRDQKVQAPDFAVPSDDFATLEELKLKLEASHQGLAQLVTNADEHVLANRAFLHPVFGEMSLNQWIPFIGWHEKRHTLQIKEVKTVLGLA